MPTYLRGAVFLRHSVNKRLCYCKHRRIDTQSCEISCQLLHKRACMKKMYLKKLAIGYLMSSEINFLKGGCHVVRWSQPLSLNLKMLKS